MNRIHPHHVLVLVVAALLPACATKRYEVSAIGAVPKTAGHVAGHGAKLKLSGLEVAIETLDAVPIEAAPYEGTSAGSGNTPASGGAPLSLRLRFASSELGYSFDPSRVVLRSGGRDWHAREFAGAGCSDPGAAAEAGEGRVWLLARSCFGLAFEAAVGAGDGQALVLDGLARGRSPIAPVVLPIARRRATAHVLTRAGERALMVPLYILLLPFAAAGAVF